MTAPLDGAVAAGAAVAASALAPVAAPDDPDEARAALRDALAHGLRRAVGPWRTVIAEDNVRTRSSPGAVVGVDVGVRGRLAGRHVAVVACAWHGGGDGDRRAVHDAAWRIAVAAEDARADAYLVLALPAGAEPALGRLDAAEVARVPMGGSGREVLALRVTAPAGPPP